MQKCNKCYYQEKNCGKLVCQHKASMEGIEAEKEYYDCDEVNDCNYSKESSTTCAECTESNCYIAMMKGKCPKR